MAKTSIATLVVDLVASDAQFRKDLRGAMKNAEREMRRMGAKFTRIGKEMSVALTAPILAAGVAIVKFGVEFDTAMREVNTLLGLSEKEFVVFKKEIRELSVALGVDLKESAAAAYQAISAGIPKANLADFLTVASKAAIAGVASTSDAVSVLTKTMDAYGSETVSAQTLSDQLFATVKGGVTTFEELASALPNVTGLAATLGTTQAELLGVFARTSKVSESSAGAVTRIASAMGALTKKNADMVTLLKKAGIANVEAAIRTEGFTATLLRLRDAAKGNQDVLAKAFGRKEAILLMADLGKNTDKWRESIDAVNNSLGSTQAAFEIMDKGPARQIAKMKSALQGLGDVISTTLLPKLSSAVLWITNTLNKLQETSPATIELAIGFATMAAAVGPLTLAIGGMLTMISKLMAGGMIPLLTSMAAFVVVAGSMQAVMQDSNLELDAARDKTAGFGEIMASVMKFVVNAVHGVRIALNALVVGILELTNYGAFLWNGFITGLQSVEVGVVQLHNAFLTMINGIGAAYNAQIVPIWGTLRDAAAITVPGGAFLPKGSPVFAPADLLPEPKVEGSKWAKGFAEGLQEEIDKRADHTVGLVGNFPGPSFGTSADGGFGVLPPKGAVEAAGIDIAKIMAEAGEGIATGIGGGAAKAEKSLEQLASKARVVAEPIREATVGYMETFADSTARFLTSASSGFESFGDVVKDVFRNIAHDLAKSGIMQLLGGGGGKGGLFGGLLGGGGGLFGGFFASGGRPPLGKVSVVGERGPELFVPDSAGTIIPNGASGGGGSVVVNQYFDRGVDESRLGRMAANIKRDTMEGVADAVRRGGGFRQAIQT